MLWLHGLQHRGHEAFGIAFSRDANMCVVHRHGRVDSALNDLHMPPAEIAVGHAVNPKMLR
ncbi:unnamed protein product [Protopolystoma xenopodis]|uniref:Glutamine amidotransferase type-2 domain-containing protein n=1 Tax=Protopolystoma xenopodis TaxID=117903 RepID=A0A448XM98_9PLAT|nr:unnamed protein product [Protopolystoma xenopodis]